MAYRTACPIRQLREAPLAPILGIWEARVTVLEHIARANAVTFERIERRFEAIDRRFEAVDRRFDGVDRRFEAVERRLDTIIQEHRADFRWLVGIMLAMFGTMIAGFGGILGAMAHGFHWIP